MDTKNEWFKCSGSKILWDRVLNLKQQRALGNWVPADKRKGIFDNSVNWDEHYADCIERQPVIKQMPNGDSQPLRKDLPNAMVMTDHSEREKPKGVVTPPDMGI